LPGSADRAPPSSTPDHRHLLIGAASGPKPHLASPSLSLGPQAAPSPTWLRRVFSLGPQAAPSPTWLRRVFSLTQRDRVRTYSSSTARRGGNAAHVAGSPSSRASGRGGRDEIDQGLGGGCPDGLWHAGRAGLRGNGERREQRRRF